MKGPLRILFILLLFFFIPTSAFAESEYVLPYPSTMPGTIWYKAHLVQEKFEQFWYFGDFGQFDYNLKEADKYLVEAKTLFEYKQYLLAHNALQKSDRYFQKVPYFLEIAEKHGKDISEKRKILHSAALKHEEVLKQLEKELPDSFTWQPEKKAATNLNLKQELEESIMIRDKWVDKVPLYSYL